MLPSLLNFTESADTRLPTYYGMSPEEFFERCGIELLPHQWEIFKPRQRLLIPAGFGLGKSFAAAALVGYRAICCEGSKTIVVAPKEDQIKLIIWAELKKLIGPLLQGDPRYNLQTLKLEGPNSVAWGQTAESRSGMHGIHAEDLCIVVEEACGINLFIWEAIFDCLTAQTNRLIAIGNPTHKNTFWELTLQHKNDTVRWDAMISPDINKYYEYKKDDDLIDLVRNNTPIEHKPHMVGGMSPDYIERMRRELQLGNRAAWEVGILAQFPSNTAENVELVPESEVTNAVVYGFDVGLGSKGYLVGVDTRGTIVSCEPGGMNKVLPPGTKLCYDSSSLNTLVIDQWLTRLRGSGVVAYGVSFQGKIPHYVGMRTFHYWQFFQKIAGKLKVHPQVLNNYGALLQKEINGVNFVGAAGERSEIKLYAPKTPQLPYDLFDSVLFAMHAYYNA